MAQKPQPANYRPNLLNISEFRREVASAAATGVVPTDGSRRNRFERDRDKIMRIKALAVILVLVVSATLFVQMRKDNRADAAAKNCYSDAQGPSAPTICN